MLPPGYVPIPPYYPGSDGAPCAPSPRMQTPNGPIEMQQGTEVLSFAATPTPVTTGASANPGGNVNGGDDYAQLLDALVTQQPTGTWGASGGESRIFEENDVGVPAPSAVDVWMPSQGTL